MRKTKNIKVKVAKKPKICIGDHFIYNAIEWICLDIIDGNYLAITAKIWKEIAFDVDNWNNWEKSSLRRVLNVEFLDKFDKNYLVMQTSDLTADNGDRRYGTCKDYITLLSCDQYRKYRDLVPYYPEWMWTLTPWNCYNGNDSDNCSGHSVRDVHPDGFIVSCGARIDVGVAPVILISSQPQQLNQLWKDNCR